ncbi:MAG TPA: hypothetical protein VI318_25030 [Baekduia sp.]
MTSTAKNDNIAAREPALARHRDDEGPRGSVLIFADPLRGPLPLTASDDTNHGPRGHVLARFSRS